MADITLVKISALPAAEQIGAEDLLPVVQEGATKAVAYGVIKDDIAEELAPDATLSEAGKAADAKAVGDALALKADKTELTAEVNRIDAALATKANTNDVNAALETKANADEVTAALALKADTATVNAELATKANTADVNNLLAAKANVASPVFTGRPQAPTAAKGTATLQLATTAFVQNAIDDKQDTLTFDTTPTEGSTNPVTSGGVAAKLTTLDDGLINIGKQVNKTYYPYWERGGLDRNNNVIVASPYNKIYRARTPIDHPIHLSKGDTIQTEDGFMFFCLYMDEGVAQSSTKVKRWNVPKDIDAYIAVLPSTESGDEIPVETLVNSISITYASGELTKVQDTLYLVLTSTTKTAGAVDSPTHRACWADYSFSESNYVVRISGTLDASANTRVLLMKAHTLNTADIIKEVYIGAVSDGTALYFSVTAEEASQITCIAVSQYTALAVNYKVELFNADQYYWKIEKLTDDINNLMLGGMPEYYVDHIAEKIQEVNADTRFSNGICFPFITDIHFKANSKNSKYLLKNVLDATACDFVVAGGDYGATGATADESRQYISDLLEYASYVGHERWLALNGNHDFTGSVNLTWGECYNAIFRPSERWTDDGNTGGYFCINNKAQKTKIVCLNSCAPDSTIGTTVVDGAARFGYDQMYWLIQRLAEGSNTRIIVVSHIASDPAMSGYAENMSGVQTVLEALISKTSGSVRAGGRDVPYDFSNTTNALICHISGHSHKDESHVSNGVLSISTTCDAHYRDDGHGAVAGTVTEQAFDVFCIDYDAETINAVRVGRGASRLWNKVNNEWVESV